MTPADISLFVLIALMCLGFPAYVIFSVRRYRKRAEAVSQKKIEIAASHPELLRSDSSSGPVVDTRIPIACCSFWLDDEALKAFADLFLKKGFPGIKRWFFLVGTIFLVIFGFALFLLFRLGFPFLDEKPVTIIVTTFIFVVSIPGVFFGATFIVFLIYLLAHRKGINWESSFGKRLLTEFNQQLIFSQTSELFPIQYKAPRAGVPLRLLALVMGLLTRRGPDPEEVFGLSYYVCWLFGKTEAPTDIAVAPHPYTVYFYDYGIYFVGEKNTVPFVLSYAELEDVLQDKTTPGWALLTRKNSFAQFTLLVKKNAFVFGSWRDVANHIADIHEVGPEALKERSIIGEAINSNGTMGYMPESEEEWLQLKSETK